MNLERAGLALFLPIPLDLRDEPVEFLGRVAPAVHPAVEARRATQRGIVVAADQDRDGLGGGRAHLRLGNVVELAVEFEVFASGEALNDLDAFVHPLAALGEWDANQLVVLRPWAGAHAESEPIAGQRRQRTRLFGGQRR